MTEQVTFTLPVLAKPWERARIGRKGQHFTAADTRAFEALVRDTAQLALGRSWDLDGMYSLGVVAVLPDYKTRDGDNIYKACADALNGVAYRDDNQVVRGSFSKLYEGPVRVVVTVLRLGDWPVKRKASKPGLPPFAAAMVRAHERRSQPMTKRRKAGR